MVYCITYDGKSLAVRALIDQNYSSSDIIFHLTV